MDNAAGSKWPVVEPRGYHHSRWSIFAVPCQRARRVAVYVPTFAAVHDGRQTRWGSRVDMIVGYSEG